MMFQCVTCGKEDVLVHEPRMLDCGHLICLRCIPKETFNGVVLCPKCLGDTILPHNGASHLQQGAILKQLVDLLKVAEEPCAICGHPATYKCTQHCNKVLCAYCMERQTSLGCKHSHADLITMHCRTHTNFLVSEFCNECNKPLCIRCITEDTCSKPKINIKETINKRQITTTLPKENLLSKKKELEQRLKEISEVEQQVLKNTKEIIQIALKAEKVILQQLKQNKQAVQEQLKSADILLNQDAPSRHHHPFKSNGPAITLLMEKLRLHMLEACLNAQESKKFAFTKGNVKPQKLVVFSKNEQYERAVRENEMFQNINSWEINDIYEYVSTNDMRISPLDFAKLSEISWTRNDFYIEAENYYNPNGMPNGNSNKNDATKSNKNQRPTDLNWVKNDTYMPAGLQCNYKNTQSAQNLNEKLPVVNGVWGSSPKASNSPSGTPPLKQKAINPLLGPPMQTSSPPKSPSPQPKIASLQQNLSLEQRLFSHQQKLTSPQQMATSPQQLSTSPQPTKPGPPRLPKPKIQLGISFDEVDSTPTPRLDPNFIEFAEKAEDYHYVDDYTLHYTEIKWTCPPEQLKNWTSNSSKILVTPDGQTILAYHSGSSTQILSFNDSGHQQQKPIKVNYKVLDMTYSSVHRSIVLLDKKAVHFMDIGQMKEKWKFELPKSEDKDYSQLSCAMLRKGFLLVFIV